MLVKADGFDLSGSAEFLKALWCLIATTRN